MNNNQLQLALEIATFAHKNVTRRNGDLYISTLAQDYPDIFQYIMNHR